MATWELDLVGAVSMLYTLVTFICSYAVAWHLLGVKFRISPADRHVMAWLIWDIIIHVTIEGPFVVISLLGTVKESQSFLADVWKEYGKADARWLVSDPTIVSLEIATVFFVTPLCIALIYAICKQKHYRHFLQISICICELYGGWMTFAPELLVGSQNLETSNFIFLYVYLIFYNGIWVVVPAILLYQSCTHLKALSTGGSGASFTSSTAQNLYKTNILGNKTEEHHSTSTSRPVKARKRRS